MSAPANDEFESFLTYLRDVRHFDFTGYKRGTLNRRTLVRMQEVGIQDVPAYQDYLEVHPEEFAALFDRILINVTEFFRDRPVWNYLSTDIIPKIVASHDNETPIRVWCAGCATGEEAYSLAIAFGEVLGVDSLTRRLKIYATDISEDALATARSGTYPADHLGPVGDELADKYFERRGTRRIFRSDLRSTIIFGRHDLGHDAPMARLDLLSCRNTLMYFNAEVQAKIAARMHYALLEGGYLLLGRAEMLLNQSAPFEVVSLKHRLFQRSPAAPREPEQRVAAPPLDVSSSTELRDATLDFLPVAQITIDRAGIVTTLNRRARNLFDLGVEDIGRPFRDLEVSYRPADLRGAIDAVYAEGKSRTIREIESKRTDGTSDFFDVTVTPLRGRRNDAVGVSVVFEDLTRYHLLRKEHQRATELLGDANDDLTATNEALEATNEELQSTVQELETTNEELQSTNEELETLNEEMQSTNAELQTLNEEMHERGTELDAINNLLRSILASLTAGVCVVDQALRVTLWNARAEDLWGVRSDEATGVSFMDLDIGLPTEKLASPLAACLAGTIQDDPVVLVATNRRGRMIDCSITCTPLTGAHGTVTGVVILMEDSPHA